MNGNPPTVDPIAAAQLQSLVHEVKNLRSAYANAFRMRLAVMVAAIAVVATLSWLVVGRVREFTSERNLKLVGDAAAKRFEHKQDYYVAHLQSLSNRVSPVVTQAFLDQAKKDMPQFVKAIEKERQPLLDNLQNKVSKRITHKFEQLKPELTATMVEEFSQLQDRKLQEAVVNNVERAIESMVVKYYLADLRNEVETLYVTWDRFPQAPAPIKGHGSVQDQFLNALLDLLAFKLMHPTTDVTSAR